MKKNNSTKIVDNLNFQTILISSNSQQVVHQTLAQKVGSEILPTHLHHPKD